jgi:chromosome segregation ATPase
MDMVALAPIAVAALAIVLEVVRRLLNRGADKRDARKDLRQEIAELWQRLDKLEDENTQLRGKVAELDFFKQRYFEADTENKALRKRVSELETQVRDHETTIGKLQQQITQLQSRRRQPS